MTKLKLSAADLVAEARSQIPEVTTEEALAMASEPDVVIVDIRDIRERAKTGFIPGSLHAPRGMLEFWVDPDSPYHKPEFAQEDKRYVFHCASGWRSALAVFQLQKMGFEAAHMKDGFNDWVAKGGAVEKDDRSR
ncbi:molybdopterin biosynthesis protein MoeB [Roseivivax sp. THAF40]|uniref:rhodanese-like domain-containing protein n=1 Tax=unclassified Roseivivax TaxID=2639302 RepID=UPI001267D3D9|nr:MULTISPECIES: rhodanese-like domain-containing protein [unclassified Roseivivax]QFS84078.1 molybdopterin biosynthesis protein MoeB [Roseivivax sp. THAF197b]QFT47905.1 molybdopterin biosynthesis protein MoeB [Roseivivax sp. THAF40]